MSPLKVNFAPRRTTPNWLWGGCVIGLSLLATTQGHLAWQLTSQARANSLNGARIRKQIDELARVQEKAKAAALVEPAYAHDAREVAQTTKFPLQQVLGSLEAARVEGVHLTALEVSASKGTARGELEFTTHETLLHYLDEVNAGEPARRWALIQAQSSSANSAGTATIVFAWEISGP